MKKNLNRPQIAPQQAAELAHEHFGAARDAVAQPLPSDRDCNFRIQSNEVDLVLKIFSPSEERRAIECEDAAIRELLKAEPDFPTPHPVPTVTGEFLTTCSDSLGRRCWLRSVTWCEGRVLATRSPTPQLIERLGSHLGVLDRTLASFEHPGALRTLDWDLTSAVAVVGRHLDAVKDERRRSLLSERLDWFHGGHSDRLGSVRRSTIHNDANDYNLLVEDDLRPERIEAILDFGDLVESATVCELGVALAYLLFDQPEPTAIAARLVSGYHREHALSEEEISLVYPLATLRWCLTVAMSARQRAREPDNEYLSISEDAAWRCLEMHRDLPDQIFEVALRRACGLDGHARSAAVAKALANARHPVLGRQIDPEQSVVLDFGFGGELSNEPEKLDQRIDSRLAEAGPDAIGIGLYDEARFWYTAHQFEVPAPPAHLGERRTVHLGIDLFAQAGHPVFAPLAGTVVSARDNAEHLDYGPTIILEHSLPAGSSFFTLYGHLSRESLEGMAPGRIVAAGEQLATLGSEEVNGGWSPHLHLQVMLDLLGNGGNFPGVAAPSQRELWCELCPSPAGLTGVVPEKRCFAGHGDALDRRRRVMGPSLSLSYLQPLEITCGRGDTLIDSSGCSFVDLVNNVCHVGHCHPHVVAAADRQMRALNTNTRYLSPVRLDYLEHLASLFPDPLEVVFLVNSGSEANDLALRMAREFSGSNEVMCLEAAYHGHLLSTLDVSPYKHDGAGGRGTPAHVHKMPLPDLFRGSFRTPEFSPAEAGRRYVAQIEQVFDSQPEESDHVGPRIGTFIHESILSCGGQIVLPPGYLRGAYRAARRHGALCIADEVQVGFGRVGTHLWAFETQGVVPDIVTLGKPIGNGHPMAAVVTTRAIATAFANGMEYFNTFGGNPVSCAIGQAVLDVVEAEGLQHRALELGHVLLDGLGAIAEEFEPIGDVRGLGLFLGFELVRAERQPWPELADWIVQQMRQRGFLVSTDGPQHNVIKIKPPLVLTDAHARGFLEALRDTLRFATL